MNNSLGHVTEKRVRPTKVTTAHCGDLLRVEKQAKRSESQRRQLKNTQ